VVGAAVGCLVTGMSAERTYAGEGGCVGDCYVKDRPFVINRTFKRRIQVQQSVYEIAREPSLYGWTRQKVLLEHDVEWRETPAVYQTIHVKERTPSRYVWEKRLIRGREVMCKIRIPGKTVMVEKRVLVSPARRIAKPVYGYVERRVLLRPYKNIAIYHPARHVYTTERVAVQPEGHVWRKVRGGNLWD